jgi:hypothetical protein
VKLFAYPLNGVNVLPVVKVVDEQQFAHSQNQPLFDSNSKYYDDMISVACRLIITLMLMNVIA